MLERLFALETFGIKLGLENIQRLCEALGHPERRFASLHVAGTNGKGSVTSMTHAALVAAGIRAARYTSPHLADITERFVIGRDQVEADHLQAVAEEVLDCADRLQATGGLSVPPTFFEVTTAIAFELFRRAGVEVAVIEVGLGGRFDATNVITPMAGAITTIAYDHQRHLGNTLASIAFEKAGIIKAAMPVVTGPLPADAMQVIREVVAERGARLIEANAGVAAAYDLCDGRAELRLTTPDATYGPATLALRGEHQVTNAIVAVRLLEAARAAGVPISDAAIVDGLTAADWPARLEVLPLGGGKRVLLDAAHNTEGAQALAAYLRRWHPERPPLVVGIMRDKDADDILQELLPVTSTVVATEAPTPRALPSSELAVKATAAGATDVRVNPDAAGAIEQALALSDTVCVAGSIFLAGAVRDGLKRRAQA